MEILGGVLGLIAWAFTSAWAWATSHEMAIAFFFVCWWVSRLNDQVHALQAKLTRMEDRLDSPFPHQEF